MEKTEKHYYQNLYEVIKLLSSERIPHNVLRIIAENVTRAIGAKGCSFMLLTQDRRTLLHTHAFGLSEAYLRKGPIRADLSIAEALEGKPVAVLDATEDSRIMYREQVQKEGIASILCVPIRLNGEVIGVLRVYTATPYRFSDDDITFAEIIANLGTIALDNLRAYESIQKEYEENLQIKKRMMAELGDEWTSSDEVKPSKETGPHLSTNG